MGKLEEAVNGLRPVEDVIEEYMPLAESLAWDVFKRLRHNDINDLRGEAYLALVSVLNYAVRRKQIINAQYLKKRIFGRLFDYGYTRGDIKTSRGKKRRRALEYIPLTPIIVDSGLIDDQLQESLCYGLKESYSVPEIISMLSLTPDEVEVLEMRVEGYKLVQVAEKRGTTIMAVSRMLAKMRKRCICLHT